MHCPLCHRKMGLTKDQLRYVCFYDQIAIGINDPLVEQQSYETKEECPNCRKYLRAFKRSDGYKKLACLGCGLSIENDPQNEQETAREIGGIILP